MAPTEIHYGGETSRKLPFSSNSSKQQKELPNGTGSSMKDTTYRALDHGPNDKDDHQNLHEQTHIDDQAYQHNQQTRARKPQRRVRRRRSLSNTSSTTSIKNIPQVQYAKGGILLSPPSIILDRGGDGVEEVAQVLPGETLYFSPSTNKATGQYQMHPGINNGANHNGNGINYNGNGNGIMNGGPQQPHHYNPNGVGVGMGGAGAPPHYPFNSYPHPGAYPTYYDPHGQYVVSSNSTQDGLNVRGEEVGIVLVVLLLWVGAIILFFNRWGKIRMLEPYQPKFCESHRPSCPMAEVTAISTAHPVCRERGFSKYNLSLEGLNTGSPHFVKCNYHGVPSNDVAATFSGYTTAVIPGGLTIPAGFPTGGSTGMLNAHRNSIYIQNHHHHQSRPRQNSVFVTSPSSHVSSFYGSDATLKNSSRKTKSAVDLPTLVLTGEFIDNVRRNSKNSITQL